MIEQFLHVLTLSCSQLSQILLLLGWSEYEPLNCICLSNCNYYDTERVQGAFYFLSDD